mmetsp:Transcript_16400/g.42017  ORF Transcript_16400/g.42017 Transcript_16400/m.42017 type:complete len:251 (-) Transcript_16400:1597-2349(-)
MRHARQLKEAGGGGGQRRLGAPRRAVGQLQLALQEPPARLVGHVDGAAGGGGGVAVRHHAACLSERDAHKVRLKRALRQLRILGGGLLQLAAVLGLLVLLQHDLVRRHVLRPALGRQRLGFACQLRLEVVLWDVHAARDGRGLQVGARVAAVRAQHLLHQRGKALHVHQQHLWDLVLADAVVLLTALGEGVAAGLQQPRSLNHIVARIGLQLVQEVAVGDHQADEVDCVGIVLVQEGKDLLEAALLELCH